MPYAENRSSLKVGWLFIRSYPMKGCFFPPFSPSSTLKKKVIFLSSREGGSSGSCVTAPILNWTLYTGFLQALYFLWACHAATSWGRQSPPLAKEQNSSLSWEIELCHEKLWYPPFPISLMIVCYYDLNWKMKSTEKERRKEGQQRTSYGVIPKSLSLACNGPSRSFF